MNFYVGCTLASDRSTDCCSPACHGVAAQPTARRLIDKQQPLWRPECPQRHLAKRKLALHYRNLIAMLLPRRRMFPCSRAGFCRTCFPTVCFFFSKTGILGVHSAVKCSVIGKRRILKQPHPCHGYGCPACTKPLSGYRRSRSRFFQAQLMMPRRPQSVP